MNKLNLFPLVILAAAGLLFGSCAKPAPGQEPSASGNAEAAPVAKTSADAGSFIMLQGLSLWTRDGDTVKYAKAATLGDRVTVLGKPLMLKSDGKDKEFTQVAAPDGKDYLVRSPYVVDAAYLAVVSDPKCVLYSEPKVINATKTVVPRLTLVAVVAEDPAGSGFVKISYADSGSIMVTERWIKAETLVRQPADVDVAIALAVVGKLTDKDADLKINILEGAVSSYSSSVLAGDLEAALLALKGPPAPEMEPYEAACYVISDGVSVRSAPDASSDNVIAAINSTDMVQAVERSVEKYSVDGEESHWYRISSPYEGWVFGGSLSVP